MSHPLSHGAVSYRSLTSQTLHYFARPHTGMALQAIHSPAAWRGDKMRTETSWIFNLSPEDQAEILQAVSQTNATHKPTSFLTTEDFPLPSFTERFIKWREILKGGSGFFLIRGAPVGKMSLTDAERFFFCWGLHLGEPGAQNPANDLLGHVRDYGRKAGEDVRFYMTAKDIAYHCDACDAVGLLCLNKARSGGESRIVSSVTVYNEMLKEYPDLVPYLYQPLPLDTHGDGQVHYIRVSPCCYWDGELSTFYHSDYFRSGAVLPRTPPLSQEQKKLFDAYESIAKRPDLYLDMDLEPGDMQFVSNHTVLHARTAYEDYGDDISQQRHLLRLWLSLKHPRDWHERWAKGVATASFATEIIKRKLEYRLPH